MRRAFRAADRHRCDDTMDPSHSQHGGMPRPQSTGGPRHCLATIGARAACDRRRPRAGSRRGGELWCERSGWRARSLVLIYSVAVLTHVAAMGTIGVRCMFGTKVEEEIPGRLRLEDSRPRDRGLAAVDRGL